MRLADRRSNPVTTFGSCLSATTGGMFVESLRFASFVTCLTASFTGTWASHHLRALACRRQPILNTREMWKLPHFCAEGSTLLAPKFHRCNVFSTSYTESLRSWVCCCKQPVEFRVFKHRIVVLENSGKHDLITRIIYNFSSFKPTTSQFLLLLPVVSTILLIVATLNTELSY